MNISKQFDHLNVIDKFDLSVKKGSFTALIGPSGCGKSTLFDVLMGLTQRNRGEIIWENRKIQNLLGHAALMHQKDLLLPWLNLLENAILPGRIKGEPVDRANEKARDLFQKLCLHGFEEYYPSMVSGGMRQRCALARTLMTEHKLVLLDEPLSSLDAITRRNMHFHLLQLQQEFGKTLLMITHDIEEALVMADEVILVCGSPMKIMDRYSIKSKKPRSHLEKGLQTIKEYLFSRLEEKQ